MTSKRKTAAIIGSGNVGANAALLTALGGGADVVLVDIVAGLAEGRALDISQALTILGAQAKVTGAADYAAVTGADIVVITAGLPRQPGMSRTDLLGKNAAVIKSICAQIKRYAPEALVIVVTNPLDVMVSLAHRELGCAPERVMGMGGLLDSGRFAHFLAEASGASRAAITATVIGAHGDEMVPVVSSAAAGGNLFRDLIGEAALAEAAQNARRGGAQIVGLLKTGSAAYAPGAAISLMIKSIALDEKRVFSVCAYLAGEYGQEDIFLSVPAALGAGGVERVIELDLSPGEAEGFSASAAAVRAAVEEADRI